MFPNTDKPLLAIPNVNDDILEMDDDEVTITILFFGWDLTRPALEIVSKDMNISHFYFN